MLCMVEVLNEEVIALSKSSGLVLSNEEVSNIKKLLSNILEKAQVLKSVDTTGLAPTSQVSNKENVWREDLVEEGVPSKEILLDLAPDRQDGSIKVPRVL